VESERAMSGAVRPRRAPSAHQHMRGAHSQPLVGVWVMAACVLGGVLLVQMLGALWSGWTIAAAVAAGLLLWLVGLLVASPLAASRPLSAAALYALSPADFERFVAELFASAGYLVRVVGGSGDGGVDVRVWRDGRTGVVQCKRYRPDRTLGPAAVRELVGTRAHERASCAWLATTARLSPAAQRLAEDEGVVVLDPPLLMASARRVRPWRRSLLHGRFRRA
jgi:hypothetical protein